MANNPNPDRDVNYMIENWGTNRLVTDYGSLTDVFAEDNSSSLVSETEMDMKDKYQMQNDAHSLIRNDDDYDDWEYGTEPSYFQDN